MFLAKLEVYMRVSPKPVNIKERIRFLLRLLLEDSCDESGLNTSASYPGSLLFCLLVFKSSIVPAFIAMRMALSKIKKVRTLLHTFISFLSILVAYT